MLKGPTKITFLGLGKLMSTLARELSNKYPDNIFAVSRNINFLTKFPNQKNAFCQNLSLLFQDRELSPTTHCYLSANIIIVSLPPTSEHISIMKSLVELLKKYNPQVHIYYCSSISVYRNNLGIVTEDSQTPALSTNAQIIREAEQVLEDSHLTTTILRLGGLYGEGRHPAYFLSDRPLKNGKELTHLISHQEVHFLLLKLMAIPQKSNFEIYNLVNDIRVKKADFYQTACKLLKILPPKVNSSCVQEADLRRLLISNQKVKDHTQHNWNFSQII